MTCKEVEREWEQWLDGRASAHVRQHLDTCPRCRRQAAELARTSDWMKLLQQPVPAPGPAFWARLRKRLGEEDTTADFWSALGWVAARAALALSLIVLLLGLGVMLEPEPRSPRPVVAEFDAPHSYVEDGSALVAAGSQPDRDRVVMTLVAYTEPQE